MAEGIQFRMKEIRDCIKNIASFDSPVVSFDEYYSRINPVMYLDMFDQTMVCLGKMPKAIIPTDKTVHVFLEFGGDTPTEEFYNGFTAAMLYLREFIGKKHVDGVVSTDELQTVMDVFDRINLPSSGGMHKATHVYADLMVSLTEWLSQKSLFSTEGFKSNYEFCKFLSKYMCEYLPGIPFASYYVGSFESKNQLKDTESFTLDIDFTKFMNDVQIKINNPRVVLRNASSPVTATSIHPLTETAICQKNGVTPEWITAYKNGDEIKRWCKEDGIDFNELNRYTLTTPKNKHMENLANKHPIAVFIDKHLACRSVYAVYAEELQKRVDKY